MAQGCLWCSAVLIPLIMVTGIWADDRLLPTSYRDLVDMIPVLGLMACPPCIALAAKVVAGWTLRRQPRQQGSGE